ncbi:MAG: hypothetical protein ACPGAO_03535 [Flavobacteriaceae bacterium]
MLLSTKGIVNPFFALKVLSVKGKFDRQVEHSGVFVSNNIALHPTQQGGTKNSRINFNILDISNNTSIL